MAATSVRTSREEKLRIESESAGALLIGWRKWRFERRGPSRECVEGQQLTCTSELVLDGTKARKEKGGTPQRSCPRECTATQGGDLSMRGAEQVALGPGSAGMGVVAIVAWLCFSE